MTTEEVITLNENPETLKELQCEIGKWSRKNFGNQTSKVRDNLVLNSLAPLLGIMEEAGEFEEGDEEGDASVGVIGDAELDAIGDMGVYLLDYCCRESIVLATLQKTHKPTPKNKGSVTSNLLITLGRCLLYTSPSPRDRTRSRMPSSA